MYVYVRVCACIHVHVCICICMCTYIIIYIYKYTHINLSFSLSLLFSIPSFLHRFPPTRTRQTHHQDGGRRHYGSPPPPHQPRTSQQRADYTITTLPPTFDDTSIDNPRGHSFVTNLTLEDFSIGSLSSSSASRRYQDISISQPHLHLKEGISNRLRYLLCKHCNHYASISDNYKYLG